jgi:methionine-gamma-lyase
MKTLALRMDRHNSNAMDIARFLEGHEKVERVLYPGLSSFPQKDIAGKQMKGNGGMIAFVIKNARDVPLFLNALKLCTLAVSLGETATLVQHPASMTHAVIPRENRLKYGIYGIPDELVRMSVGLDVEDIIADVKQALGHI